MSREGWTPEDQAKKEGWCDQTTPSGYCQTRERQLKQ
jgi:hypothetical protein